MYHVYDSERVSKQCIDGLWKYLTLKNWYENFNIALSSTRGHNSVKMLDRVMDLDGMGLSHWPQIRMTSIKAMPWWTLKNWYENFNIALSSTRGHNSVKMLDRVMDLDGMGLSIDPEDVCQVSKQCLDGLWKYLTLKNRYKNFNAKL